MLGYSLRWFFVGMFENGRHFHVFSCRAVLQEVLNKKETFLSLRRDVLPYLVRNQLVSLITHDVFLPHVNFVYFPSKILHELMMLNYIRDLSYHKMEC